jgi:hypothetical protein
MRYGKGFATATLAMLTVGCAYNSPEPNFIIRKAEYDGRQQAVQDNRAINSWAAGGSGHQGLNQSCSGACHDAWGRPLSGQQNISAPANMGENCSGCGWR